MTEPDTTADDEIVSAYLDGEATPAEVARVEREPALQARVEAFRSAAAAVSAISGVDPDQRDLQITRAVATAGVPDQSASTDDLEARRQARAGDRAGAGAHRARNLLLGAAAAVAVFVLGAGLLPRLLDDEDVGETTAFSAAGDDVGNADEESDLDTARDEAVRAAPPAADEDAAEGGEATSESTVAAFDAVGGTSATLPDLGDHPTRAAFDAALAVELRQRLSELAAPAAPLSDPASLCVPAIVAGDTELVDLVYGATARVEGVAVETLVFTVDPTTSANGSLRLYLVDPMTCTPVPDGVETFGS